MRPRVGLSILMLAAATAGCSPSQRPSGQVLGASTPISSTKLDITFTHQHGHPEWLVSYNFSEPVEGLTFAPYNEPYRATTWQQVEGSPLDWRAGSMGSGPSAEDLIPRQGNRFDHIAFAFDRLPVVYPKAILNTKLFLPFTDGSTGVYWGELTPFKTVGLASGGAPSYERLVPSFHIVPRPDETLIVEGTVAQGAKIDFTASARANGSWMYFGTLPVSTVNGFPVVADPAIPAGTVAMMKEVFKNSFALYQATWGALPFSASVLFAHNPNEGSTGAGGEAYWAQFIVYASGQNNPTSDESESINEVIAHETSHWWNAITYQQQGTSALTAAPESTNDTWISEGGADALAYGALLKLGLITQTRYAEKRGRLLSDCQSDLGAKRVIDVATDAQGLIWAPYDCGRLEQDLVVSLAAKVHPGYDIFQFWKELMANAGPEKNYDNLTFVKTVQAAVPHITPEQMNALRNFTSTPGTRLKALVDLLKPN